MKLSDPQNRALAILEENGPMTRKDMALAFGSGWRTVMGSLRKKGVVLGVQDPDTFVVTYYIAGRQS